MVLPTQGRGSLLGAAGIGAGEEPFEPDLESELLQARLGQHPVLRAGGICGHGKFRMAQRRRGTRTCMNSLPLPIANWVWA
jgi:hypothetical protein